MSQHVLNSVRTSWDIAGLDISLFRLKASFSQATLLQEEKKYEEALKTYDELLEIDPGKYLRYSHLKPHELAVLLDIYNSNI